VSEEVQNAEEPNAKGVKHAVKAAPYIVEYSSILKGKKLLTGRRPLTME